MATPEPDPERGRLVAAELRKLGLKGKLIDAAEPGYITELECKTPRCFCPEELGGATHFENVTSDWSDWRSDWMPTLEHAPIPKREGGTTAVDNCVLAHRLCNRLDFSIAIGRSHRRDLDPIERARAEGLRRRQRS